MADRKPLVLATGEVQQIQTADRLVDPSPSAVPYVSTFQSVVDPELLARLNLAILL